MRISARCVGLVTDGPPPLQPISRVHLHAAPGSTTFEALCLRFPKIHASVWLDRFTRGRVLDQNGAPIRIADQHQPGQYVSYFREVTAEEPIPFTETILYQDEHLVVADKPHFLPITPTGQWVTETLLSRLMNTLNTPHLSPIHRLDRSTAGLVLLAKNPESRNAYQALFRDRKIEKTYEALAPPLHELTFPHVRRTRIVRADRFFLSQEVPGEANSETHIQVLARGDHQWHYSLSPRTGKKHQLRLHMAALGAPLFNDPYYPVAHNSIKDDYNTPMALIARQLKFLDPLTGAERHFVSNHTLETIR